MDKLNLLVFCITFCSIIQSHQLTGRVAGSLTLKTSAFGYLSLLSIVAANQEILLRQLLWLLIFDLTFCVEKPVMRLEQASRQVSRGICVCVYVLKFLSPFDDGPDHLDAQRGHALAQPLVVVIIIAAVVVVVVVVVVMMMVARVIECHRCSHIAWPTKSDFVYVFVSQLGGERVSRLRARYFRR